MAKVVQAFPSKVLLFGEYTVINQSMALTIPFSLFEGQLIFCDKGRWGKAQDLFSQDLYHFSQYMEQKKEEFRKLDFTFHSDRLLFDLDQGLFFSSSIPQGVGVGSSGALCAALFSLYGDFLPGALSKQREVFKLMESFFHGASSGVDPLVSFLKHSLLLNSKEKKSIELVEEDFGRKLQGRGESFFLLDSRMPRKTGPLVNLFLEKCKDEKFNTLLNDKLIPFTNKAIDNLLGLQKNMLDDIHAISSFQYQHFDPMIPSHLQEIWKESLESNFHKIKLCGAGGGGFMLGFTKDFAKTSALLKGFSLREIVF